jgi:hypothetical protein
LGCQAGSRRKRVKSDPRSLPNSPFCLKSGAAFRTRALWHLLSPQVGGTVCKTPYLRCRFFLTKAPVRK